MVESAIKTDKQNMADTRSTIAKLKKNLADAKENLNCTVESYVKT